MTARVRKKPLHDAYLEYVVTLPDPLSRFHPEEYFPDPGPVELEIGFGKGRYILTAAATHPDVHYLGIEIRHSLRDFVATRLAKRDLRNARVMQGDAGVFLGEVVPPDSFQAVHLLFPDPWWKKRHYKRRVWTPDLFEHIERTLEPGGHLHVASDVPHVYEAIVSLAASRPGLREEGAEAARILCTTNFEDKAMRDGRPVQRKVFRKE